MAELAEREKRPAGDYARMAEETISFGSNPEAVNQLKDKIPDAADPHAPWRNMVQDALAGVDEGERLDAKAANWPELREKLKKLQPPPPPPSGGGSGKDKKDQPKNQKKDKKQQKASGQQKQQQSGEGQKSDQKDGGEGQDGKGESQGPPSQGQSGKGNKKGGKEEGDSDGSSGQGERQQQQPGGEKDPNAVRDFSNRKDGEGQMRNRGSNQDMKAMQDEKAGFGSMGQEKKEGKEAQGVEAGQTGEKKEKPTAPPGMRVVGGGSGQKANDKTSDPITLEAMSRLDQVRQSDSPAILQQRLQPQDQRPQPSSLGKPW